MRNIEIILIIVPANYEQKMEAMESSEKQSHVGNNVIYASNKY